MKNLIVVVKVLIFVGVGFLWLSWTTSPDPEVNGLSRLVGLLAGLIILFYFLNLDKWEKEKTWRKKLENAVSDLLSQNSKNQELETIRKLYREKFDNDKWFS